MSVFKIFLDLKCEFSESDKCSYLLNLSDGFNLRFDKINENLFSCKTAEVLFSKTGYAHTSILVGIHVSKIEMPIADK